MPTPIAHALVPLAGALAFTPTRVPWKLVIVAAVAAAAPDLDGLIAQLAHLPKSSIYEHRGALHSLFVALAAGFVAALFHEEFGVRPLTAAAVLTVSVASHGLLDMMTDLGAPVAYLWPLSSIRLFADWRPLHSGPVEVSHLLPDALARLHSELRQLIIPMFGAAILVRGVRIASRDRYQRLSRGFLDS